MKPYDNEQTKKQQVERMFDNIAPTYDGLNHILSLNIDRLWRRRVVRIVRRTGAKRIMDMATGTGDLAVALAKHIDGSHILGVDLSEKMLDVAREKIRRQGTRRAHRAATGRCRAARRHGRRVARCGNRRIRRAQFREFGRRFAAAVPDDTPAGHAGGIGVLDAAQQSRALALLAVLAPAAAAHRRTGIERQKGIRLSARSRSTSSPRRAISPACFSTPDSHMSTAVR